MLRLFLQIHRRSTLSDDSKKLWCNELESFVHQNHFGLIHCSIGEQDGLVKPKDYQGEHIVGAGEPTHMISKNLLAG